MPLIESLYDAIITLTLGYRPSSWSVMPFLPRSYQRKLYNPNFKLKLYQNIAQERQDQAAAENSNSDWYHYEPLQPKHIRLLHIHLGQTSDILVCTVTTHSVDDHPPFEALSYTWGDPTEAYRISCDGKSIPVTRNLWQALQRLRPPDMTRTFWIDAVCINQGDVLERSAQVQLMGTIYREASSVVVWLGDATQDSPAAFKLMRQIHAVAEATPPAHSNEPITESDLERHHLPARSSPDWKALDAIYWRPWFMRIWIVQEITLARRAVVLCGEDSIPWPNFVAVADYIYRRNITRLVGVNVTQVITLHTTRYQYQYHSSIERHLLLLLAGFRRSLSTNPLDKVYALLSITSENSIVPDYKLLPCDVFRDVAKKFLLPSLDALSLVGDPAWKMIDGLPSWAPDWSCHLREHPYLYSGIEQVFQACGDTSPITRFSDDGKTLFAQGIILDRVNTVGELYADTGLSNPNHLLVRLIGKDMIEDIVGVQQVRQFRLWERRVLRLKRYPTGEDIETVFHKTIIANVDIVQSSPSGVSLAEMYAAFRRHWVSLPGEKNMSDQVSREADEANAALYQFTVLRAAHGRRIFTTKGGYVGLGPPSMQSDDCVVLLSGGKTAYMLRKMKKAPTFTFLGEAYVHGFMNGEGFQGDYKLEEFATV